MGNITVEALDARYAFSQSCYHGVECSDKLPDLIMVFGRGNGVRKVGG